MTDAPLPPHFRRADRPPEPLRVWESSGLLCVVALNPVLGFFLGYVLAPQIRTEEQAEELEVHGGVTYGPDAEGWIGWDAGHYSDYWPGLLDAFRQQSELRHWTQAEAEVETERLARSAALAGRQRLDLDPATLRSDDPDPGLPSGLQTSDLDAE